MKQRTKSLYAFLLMTLCVLALMPISALARLKETDVSLSPKTGNVIKSVKFEEVSDGVEISLYVEFTTARAYSKYDFYIVNEDGSVTHEDGELDGSFKRSSSGSWYIYTMKTHVKPGAKVKIGGYGYKDAKNDDAQCIAVAQDLQIPEISVSTQEVLEQAYKDFPTAKADYAYLQDFKVGEKTTIDCAAYTSCLEITKVTKDAVTFKFTLTNKVPGLAYSISGSGDGQVSLKFSGGSKGVSDADGDGTLMHLFGDETTYSCDVTAKMSDIENNSGLSKIGVGVGAFYKVDDETDTYHKEATNLYQHDAETIMYYVATPSTPGGYYIKEVKKNAITMGPNAFKATFTKTSGSILCYREVGSKKWSEKSFAGGKEMKLTGLKYATYYEIGIKSFVTEKMGNGKNVTKVSPMSKTMVQVTAPKDKPVIVSVKISGAKKRSGKRPGYWDYWGKWHSGSSFSGTTGTITITLNKKPKAKYLYVCAKGCNGSIAKITGKKVVIKDVNLGGYSKGKTVPISAAFTFDSKYKGKAMAYRPIGPWSNAKKVTVK